MRFLGALAWLLAGLLLLVAAVPAQAALAPGGTRITNTATGQYWTSDKTKPETVFSNEVVAVVQGIEVQSLKDSQAVTRPAGSQVTLNHFLTNTGNVASAYTLKLVNGGEGCIDSLEFSDLQILLDTANLGAMVGPSKLAMAVIAGTPAELTLQPGETASLWVNGTLPMAHTGVACMTLTATTQLEGSEDHVSASNVDTVTVNSVAQLSLVKSSTFTGALVPGTSQIDYSVEGTGSGEQSVKPTNLAAVNSGIFVDGNPASLVLIRDLIPAGTTYVPGTLKSNISDAKMLYRRLGEPDFVYHTDNGRDYDEATAVEVAVGFSADVKKDDKVDMQFSVKVNADLTVDISNTAQSYYSDGVHPAASVSNTLVMVYHGGLMGVAKAASPGRLNQAADGSLDGTATVHFSVLVRNNGVVDLYDVQAPDLMAGPGITQFGAYTSDTVPTANHYTVVAGTLAVNPNGGSVNAVNGVNGVNGVSAVHAAINPLFDGTPTGIDLIGENLLAPGVILPVGAELAIEFDVRINFTGRADALQNKVHARAALGPGDPPTVFGDSSNGTDPDGNNHGTTPVHILLPALSLVKTVSLPRRISPGVFELDYHFKVTNAGQADAFNVHVIDNLDCAFNMDKLGGPVASWALVGRPVVKNGYLHSAAGFTGSAICNRDQLDSSSAYVFPTEAALSMVDGNQALTPGQSEEISLTVRATEKPLARGVLTRLTNKAWASALHQHSGDGLVGAAPDQVIAAMSSVTESLLLDPQGTVYNSVTRLPVTGAVVTYSRQSCTGGAGGSGGPITADQMDASNQDVYTFNADGSVSMTTGADGVWQFFFESPPVDNLCVYGVAVTPPEGSGYTRPSQQIKKTEGTFPSCSPVVPNSGPPQGSDPTTYYMALEDGVKPDGSYCNVSHNHIPLDPGNVLGLVLRKEGNKSTVEFGDFIDYALILTNKTGFPVTGATFSDMLPVGLTYVAGSARLNGVATPDPTGGVGPKLVFSFADMALAVDATVMVRYRLRVGVGAAVGGDVVNSAQASSSVIKSNQASWRVHVAGGVFSDDAFAFGKVYMECARSASATEVAHTGTNFIGADPDANPIGASPVGVDQIGVPGVRLFMEDGTSATTDAEGKWSLYGLKPITHVLRVDDTTLPPGARLDVLDNRNAGNPKSRFMDLKKGEFHKANFIIGNCDLPAVMQDVAVRRKTLAASANAGSDTTAATRLDAQNKPTEKSRKGPSASGQTSSTGSGGGSSQSLIDLATGTGGTGAFTSAGKTDGGAAATQPAGDAAPVTPASAAASASAAPVAPAAPPIPLVKNAGAGSVAGVAANAAALANATNAANAANAPAKPTTTGTPTAKATGNPSTQAEALVSPATPVVVDLEKLMIGMDNKTGFIGLNDADIIPGQTFNVRVKGAEGKHLRLHVNEVAIGDNRVGIKAVLPSARLAAWEYVGVQLKPGVNNLRLTVEDDAGVVSDTAQLTVIAPDKVGVILVSLPPSAPADMRTPIVVKIRLTDASGVLVSARTQITLEADRGRWLTKTLSPDQPGLQTFVEGGHGEFQLLPPAESGNLRLRVSVGTLVKEAHMALLADLRPMIGVGLVDGTLDFTKRGALTLGQMPAGAVFENELASLGDDDASTSRRTAVRSAFYFKGAVKGDFLLTAAYDTNKTTNDRLFRDIRPDEFYPVYGDASTRGFDAQSTQKLYVRIDKNRSYLLYGDFTTASSSEVRQLSQTGRTLTGVKNLYETDTMRATTYASRTAQTQQVEELPALGVSGPYFLQAGNGDLLANSEKIEILVRERNQPDIVLQTTALSRFVDYTIEPLTHNLRFTRPIESVDANLNPQSIRLTYEVDSGGPEFTVAGTDVQVKVTDKLQVGVVASTDQNPDNRRELKALTALARVGDFSTVTAELVNTDTDLKGNGSAGRIEVRRQKEDLGVVAHVVKTTPEFDNPASTFSAGRTEAASRVEYKIDETTQLRGEAIYSKDALTSNSRKGVAVGLQAKLTDTMTGELGLRHGDNSSTTASMFSYGQLSASNSAQGSSVASVGAAPSAGGSTSQNLTTVRGRLTTVVPYVPQAQVFAEGEQDVDHSERNSLAVGGNYAITPKTRTYGRYELVANLDDPASPISSSNRSVGTLGVESSYMEGGRVYNEYRLSDSATGRTGQAASGVRNTFAVNKDWKLTAGVERTSVIGNGWSGVVGKGNSVALVSGAEYATDQAKLSGIFETRRGTDTITYLSSMGVGYKLNADWSLLGRSLISSSQGQGTSAGSSSLMSRQQLGVALRPVGQDVWNALARYEHKVERKGVKGGAQGAISSTAFGDDAGLPGAYTADIVSTNINYNLTRGTYITGRLAGKIATANDGFLSSTYWASLLQGRYTTDLDKDWDIGVQAGLLYGQGGALQKTAGVEVGYQLAKDTWVSVGHNFVGFSDRDLTSGEYTSKGVYVRLRFKFDEASFGSAFVKKQAQVKVDPPNTLGTPLIDMPALDKAEPAGLVGTTGPTGSKAAGDSVNPVSPIPAK